MTYLDYSATTMINKEVLEIVKQNLFKEASEEELEVNKQKIQKLLNKLLEENNNV